MSKQTPVEWLLTHLTNEGYISEKELLNRDTSLNELCRTAFEVEKLQLKQTAEFWHGKELPQPIFETYYDDTFNKNQIPDVGNMVEITDDEIWIKANEIGKNTNSSIAAQYTFEGAKWYREQLKKNNKQ